MKWTQHVRVRESRAEARPAPSELARERAITQPDSSPRAPTRHPPPTRAPTSARSLALHLSAYPDLYPLSLPRLPSPAPRPELSARLPPPHPPTPPLCSPLSSSLLLTPPPRSPTVYQDRFNLYGLKEIIGPLYGEAMSMILGYAPSEKQLSDPTQRIHKVLDTARVLYGLIHARYILTAQGLQDMKAKYKASGLQKNPSTQPHPNPSPKPSQPTLL